MKNLLISSLMIFCSSISFSCENEKEIVESVTRSFSNSISRFCEVLTYGGEEKVLTVLCDNVAQYKISYKNNEIFSVLFSKQNNLFLHQCFIAGKVNNECKTSLDPVVCESIDLR